MATPADGAWYFQLVQGRQNIHEIRDHLMFGQNHVGDVGHAGKTLAATMPDDAEVCGCNGVCKGTSSRRSRKKGCSPWTRCASTPRHRAPAAPAPGLVEQILASTVGGAYTPADTKDKPMCGCTEHSPRQVRQTIREQHLLTIPEAMQYLEWKTPNGCASCRPALNYYLISTWPGEAEDDPQSRFINERAHANIQKDGTYSRGAAHVGRADHAGRVARHRRRGRQVCRCRRSR
jgi:nitrite reductase (NADH) large subunit